MRTVGRRTEPAITFSASAARLAEGARFNDEIHRLPTGAWTGIRKGIYRFKNLADADRHDIECVAAYVAKAALDRS